MSKQTALALSSALATTVMTAFSYLFGFLLRDDTREPVLLGKLIHRFRPDVSGTGTRAAGWGMHYGIGLLFAELYGQIWKRTSLEPDVKCGLIFGGLSGLAAILIWKFTLTLHPFAPAVNFRLFAINLFLAHVLFGVVAAISSPRYRISSR